MTRDLWRGIGSRLKANWAHILGALVTAALGLILVRSYYGLGDKLIHLSYDYLFLFRPIHPPHELVLVYMDDASHADLGQPFNGSWDRGLHAQLVDRLTAAGARVVLDPRSR